MDTSRYGEAIPYLESVPGNCVSPPGRLDAKGRHRRCAVPVPVLCAHLTYSKMFTSLLYIKEDTTMFL